MSNTQTQGAPVATINFAGIPCTPGGTPIQTSGPPPGGNPGGTPRGGTPGGGGNLGGGAAGQGNAPQGLKAMGQLPQIFDGDRADAK